jgi:predicted dehydrogenase
VATPPDTHLEYAVKAMRAGKAVYVEKPMARNHAECQKMIRVSEETQQPLFVAYYRRCLSGFVKIKELVEAGAIGDVRLVNIRFYRPLEDDVSGDTLQWRLIPEIAGGGIFFDLASHQLDYLDYLFGPIEKIKSNTLNQAGEYTAEDLVLSSWVHSSGVAGTGTWCFTASEASRLDEVEIVGSRGRILASTFEFSPIILENESGRKEFSFKKPAHVQQQLMQKIVNELRGEGKSPSNGETGARTSWVLDEMVKSYYN